jgi:hypothetical protein
MWSVPNCYKLGEKVSWYFHKEGIEKRSSESEAEEFPLLEAVARERLVKIQQARIGLEGAVVICELWRLEVVL